MKKSIVVSLIFLLFSCQEKPLEFTYLPKLSGKTLSTYSSKRGGYIYIYMETSLVDNVNKDWKLTTQRVVDYFKTHHIDLCTLPLNFHSYCFSFYEKTRCTKYFIKKAEDPGGFSSNIIDADCFDDRIIDIYYRRDPQNPCQWIADVKNYNIHYQDTIYCEGCKDKIYDQKIKWRGDKQWD